MRLRDLGEDRLLEILLPTFPLDAIQLSAPATIVLS